VIGTLSDEPALDRPDLLGPTVLAALRDWPRAQDIRVAEIDPALSDTATFCEKYDVPMEVSANCVVVVGKREGTARYAACMVLATTRADVNGVVRRHLDVRKASFAAMDDAVARTDMEFGGITPIGLPDGWPVIIDARVHELPTIVIGSGVRRSKLILPGAALAQLPFATVLADLAK
jgi:prolyl-tRNA editing enzyme YbaK/EbsC (Cys-tRNA(Pro) deacylase)